MSEASFARALRRAASAMGSDDEKLRLLSRGGIRIEEIDLSDANLSGFIDVKAAEGYGVRMLRHGSNPGARLEVAFGGNTASKFFAPGQVLRGGFDNMQIKRSAFGARAGKAQLLIFNEPDADLSEDLIISAIGPVDLLGSMNSDGSIPSGGFITVAEDTDPNAAYATQTGAFDGSGWELLRVLVDGNSNGGNFTTADVIFWFNPSWTGTTWFECGLDGTYSIPDTATTGGRYRCFTVPWSGRGIGCPSVRNLLAAARTGLGFIIQGVK